MKLVPKKSLQTHLRQYKKSLTNPFLIQKKLLLEILNKNKNTVYGKKYHFKKISSIKEFQEKIPIIEYEDILPYIRRCRNGEQNILCKNKIIYFATTS
ncbi:MAG: GH3 family domain-containing protein, partial [Candidatus Nanoarchaeia archaeon]